jgi:hypothetical protein
MFVTNSISEYKCLTSFVASNVFWKTSKNEQDSTLGSSRLKPTNIEGRMTIVVIKLEKKKPIYLLHIKKQMIIIIISSIKSCKFQTTISAH